MFPYDRKLLRCHPFWIQVRSPITNADIHTSSHKTLSWVCCECDEIFNGAPKSVTVSMCRCKTHWTPYKKKNRQRYCGSIPRHITNAIRTGLLQAIEADVLTDLVASLIGKDNQETLAQTYIEEVSHYSSQQLLDSGFWWEDSYQHKDGSRYKQLPTAKRHEKERANSTSDGVVDEMLVLQSDTTTGTAPQLTIWQDAVEHMWDDVLRAIHEDPRALWGLWSTVIAPRLGPGVPQTLKEKTEWTGNNANITEVIVRLRDLGRRLAGLIENNQLIMKEAEATQYGVILRIINNEALRTPGDDRLKYLKRTIGIILGINATPILTYAMPVD